jgi:hypothetical protein
MRQRMKRAGVYLGVLLFGVAVSLTPTDTPAAGAQSAVAADAIEYGISLGLPAAWAWRVSWCESRHNVWAYNRWSGASGLFQFIPSTWMATPQGRAGLSPFDPYANAAAAAWLYHTGGPRHWSCR